MSRAKAIALFSGGLDSTLAILTVLKQDIEVTAVTFLNHFGCEISDRSSCSKDPFSAAAQFGFEVKLCHLSEKFIEIVKHPKFGHGKNMNPCMDCRILMLKEAKVFMEMTGADFIITGEVLGQRPMSQRRDSLDIIDRESGLRRQVLRPLCARLLKPTVAEERGLVERNLLHSLNGRSRKPQIELARQFGLTTYPAPAGGCLLTEPNFSFRLRELLSYTPDPELLDLHLLRIGRHFRLSPECKLVVGRDEAENGLLASVAGGKGIFLRVMNYGSPLAYLREDATAENIGVAASICARYSDAKHQVIAEVEIVCNGRNEILRVAPAASSKTQDYLIQIIQKNDLKTIVS